MIHDALRDWTNKRKMRGEDFPHLLNVWLEAVADDSDGEDPDPIVDALEHKYDALAQASGRSYGNQKGNYNEPVRALTGAKRSS